MSKEDYAILRVEKLKSSSAVTAMSRHWLRQQPTLNADPSRTKYNRVVIGPGNPNQKYQEFIHLKGIEKFRKNGVRALEFMLSFSPGFLVNETGSYHADSSIRLREWLLKSREWLQSEFGERCISAVLHLDEKTPHLHALVVPLEQRVRKNGKIESVLNARAITGGRKKLQALQDSYAEKLKKCGLTRGKRGSKARHQSVREYYTALSQAERECKLHGLAPLPAKVKEKPDQFVPWLRSIEKITDRLESVAQDEKAALERTIAELTATNERLQIELEQRRQKAVSIAPAFSFSYRPR